MVIIKNLSFLILICVFFNVTAQTYLVVDNYKGKHRAEYQVGHSISFELNGDNEVYYGVIQAIKKDRVFISQVSIDIKDISAVYPNRTPARLRAIKHQVGKTIQLAWIVPAVALLNPVIIKDSKPITTTNIALSTLAIATPFYASSRKNKKSKINGRYRIRIVSFDDLIAQ